MIPSGLLYFYLSASFFVLLVLAIGAVALGAPQLPAVRVVVASVGALLLLVGVGHLAAETWRGISVTDEQFRALTR